MLWACLEKKTNSSSLYSYSLFPHSVFHLFSATRFHSFILISLYAGERHNLSLSTSYERIKIDIKVPWNKSFTIISSISIKYRIVTSYNYTMEFISSLSHWLTSMYSLKCHNEWGSKDDDVLTKWVRDRGYSSVVIKQLRERWSKDSQSPCKHEIYIHHANYTCLLLGFCFLTLLQVYRKEWNEWIARVTLERNLSASDWELRLPKLWFHAWCLKGADLSVAHCDHAELIGPGLISRCSCKPCDVVLRLYSRAISSRLLNDYSKMSKRDSFIHPVTV